MVAESNSASAASPKISAHKRPARKTSRSIPARVSNLDFLFFKPHFLQARPYYMKSENEKRQIWLQQPACVFNIARWEPTRVLPANTREAGKWGGTAGTNTKVVRATNTRVALAEIQRKWNGSIRSSSCAVCPVGG